MATLFGQIYIGKIGNAIDRILATEAGQDIIDRIDQVIADYGSTHQGKYAVVKVVSITGENADTSSPTAHQDNDGFSYDEITVSIGDILHGVPVGVNQFATYDPSVLLIHELSHVLLWLTKGNHTEYNVAKLYNGDSYENVYTKESNYFADVAGLPSEIDGEPLDIKRIGYQNSSGDDWKDYDREEPITGSINQKGTWKYYQLHTNDTVDGKDGIDATIYGGALNETLTGGLGNEKLYGGKGSDKLYGGGGIDTLIGGAGNDELYGEEGNDTYVFSLGDGKDMISDTSGDDKVEFRNIDVKDLRFDVSTADLIIRHINGTDSITIKKWRTSSVDTLIIGGQTYRSDDGFSQLLATAGNDVMSLTDADEYIVAGDGDDRISGLDGNDILEGGNGNDTAWGDGGDDTLYGNGGYDYLNGGEGSDTLEGGEGNDTLYGGIGSDRLIGGTGDDTLFGGDGDDRYFFGIGDGLDSILDGDGSVKDRSSNDTLIVGTEITPETIGFSYNRDGSLQIRVSSNDMISVQNWFGMNSQSALTSFEFTDGTVYSRNDIYKYYLSDDNSNGITGSLHDEILYGYGGVDYISGNGGDDMIIGGKGNDEIRASYNGKETFFYAIDDGQDVIDYVGKNDTILFGPGITLDNLDIRMVTGSDRGFTGEQLMVVSIKEEGKTFEEWADKMTLRRSSYQFNFIFSDGSSINVKELNERFGFLDIDNVVAFNEENEYDLGPGNDILYAPGNGAIINAGTGDDYIETDYGNQIFLYQRGDGCDYIDDYNNFTRYNGSSENDIIRFTDDVKKEDLIFKVDGNNLIIAIKEEGKDFSELHDSITVREWYAKNTTNVQSGRIERIEFSDGTSLSPTDIISIMGTEGDDQIIGLEIADVIIGGKGNDLLIGGNGDDTYLYNLGDGSDVIEDKHDSDRIENNILQFGAGIIKGDLILKSNVNDLLILIRTGGQIRIKNWYISDTYGRFPNKMISIVLSDGTLINTQEISTMIDTDINTAPEAPIETTHTLQDIRILSGEIGATDVDGDVLNYTVSTQASHGTLSVDANGVWSYSATDGYTGSDSAIVTIDDSNGGVVTQTLNFDVKVSAPTLVDRTSNLLEDTSSTGTLDVLNPIGGTLVYEVLNASAKGVFSVNEAGEWNYTPDADLNGEDSVTIKVTNSYGLSTTATLSLAIEAVNDTPVIDANNQRFLLENTRTMGGTIAASDVDGDTLTYTVSSQATHGELSVDNQGNWSYKANGSYNGDDYAVITIDDGLGGTVTSALNFTVKGYIYEGKNLVIDDNGTDTLIMSTINKDDLTLTRNNGDLLIRVKNESTVTLKNYFTNIAAGVQTITTAQGDISLSRDVINKSQYGGYSATDSKDHLIIGDDNSNWLIGNGGDDIIVAGSGYDYVNGGDGNDLLIGGGYADNLFGGNGNDTIYADDGNDSVYAGIGNDEIFGGNGDDTLFADDGNDTVSGGAGNDTIYAGTGNDTIKGGAGNDFINGDSGSDTYLFNIGDGNDTIVDTSSYGSSDKDTLVLGAGITKDNLQIIRDNYDLVLKVNDNDSVRIQYWFGSDQRNTLESIVFADQTTLTTDQINNLAIVKGSSGCDWISGIDYMNDHMYGFAGNDGLYGYGGNDILDGGDGNDIVDGGAGNDTLIGGKGADSLNGGSGSDTYSFSIGDGADTITDWSQYGSNDVDSITFGAGITKNDVRFIMNNGNLLIGYGQNDTIKVQYAQNTQAQIEKFTLSDGNYLTSNDLNVIIQSMNAYATDHGMSITSLDNVKNNQDLMNIVAGAWHQ